MGNRLETQLIPVLFEALQKDRFVTVATIDHETGGPMIHAISWIYAVDERTIRFAATSQSRMIENLEKNTAIAINMISNESTYTITGESHILSKKVEGIPLKIAIVELAIKEIRDVMFYGSKMISEPVYEKTYDLAAAEKLDQQVIDALKKGAES
ncbi:pyridoxamine 5'-phosphate oxidase family protein [Bacillus sp. REN10]|uniref:pyridoxamine 5'-phosphate oxidase family protein n=1 Tax=Bacillus sp. REN10 TaxID=2782541 RepID=UPI00193B4237|nr:pyridoxamine 5'-phosphate oxidase family protein [Bacillus sp. REN10]